MQREDIIKEKIEGWFPALKESKWRKTSCENWEYNCIAWAAGVNDKWWWPDETGYWPEEAPHEETITAFVEAYATLGYEICDNASLEPGIEKVAIYCNKNNIPKHAARQLPNGKWTSKLGGSIDIEHTLDGLEGREYGTPVIFLARRRG